MTHPTQQHKMLVSSVLKVVQERSRVSPAIRSRVPPSQKFFFIIDPKMASFSAFWVVFYVIWSYKRVNNRLGIDPANQRVPGLRPWRPGPTLSPASPAPIDFSNQLQHKLYVQLDGNPDILIHSPVLQLSSSAFRILFHTHTSRLSQGIICIKLGNTHINTIWNGHFPSESGLAGCILICFSIDSSTTYPLLLGQAQMPHILLYTVPPSPRQTTSLSCSLNFHHTHFTLNDDLTSPSSHSAGDPSFNPYLTHNDVDTDRQTSLQCWWSR